MWRSLQCMCTAVNGSAPLGFETRGLYSYVSQTVKGAILLNFIHEKASNKLNSYFTFAAGQTKRTIKSDTAKLRMNMLVTLPCCRCLKSVINIIILPVKIASDRVFTPIVQETGACLQNTLPSRNSSQVQCFIRVSRKTRRVSKVNRGGQLQEIGFGEYWVQKCLSSVCVSVCLS